MARRVRYQGRSVILEKPSATVCLRTRANVIRSNSERSVIPIVIQDCASLAIKTP